MPREQTASRTRRFFSSLYDRMMAPLERNALGERRRVLLESVNGSVLEVGAGTGANLPYYGDGCRLLVSEPKTYMSKRLQEKGDEIGQATTGKATVPISCKAENLPFGPDAFEHVVSTLVLCSVGDQARAVSEIWRVLRPGGTFVFIEHVRGSGRRGSWQDRLQPLWSRLGQGCCPNRQTLACLKATGFVMEAVEEFDPSERFALPGRLVFQLVLPFVAGIARKPVTIS